MIQGQTLNDLSATIVAHASGKEDFLAPAKLLRFGLGSNNAIQVALPNDRAFDLSHNASRQVTEFLGIPGRFADRLSTSFPDLLLQNLNGISAKAEGRRMLRTLDGNGRAFLSDSYRRVDNELVFDGLFPTLMKLGATIESCNVSDDAMHIQAIFQRTEGEIVVGQPVKYGVTISNSETGRGATKISQLVYVLACTNGLIVAEPLRRAHIGGSFLADDLGWLALSSETQQLKTRAMVAELGEYLEAMASPERFGATLASLRAVAGQPLPAEPTPVVESLAARYSLSKNEADSALIALAEGRDYTRWGLANAVTYIANSASSYDRGVELEAVGGSIMALSNRDYHALATVPRKVEPVNA